jgi:hypothetical protein
VGITHIAFGDISGSIINKDGSEQIQEDEEERHELTECLEKESRSQQDVRTLVKNVSVIRINSILIQMNSFFH